MHSKKIINEYLKYMSEKQVSAGIVNENDRVAILYGDNEIEMDRKRGRFKLPEIGWLEFDEESKDKQLKHISFAYLIQGEDKKISFGAVSGFKPFSEEAKSILPTKQNVIVALPYSYKKIIKASNF